MGFIVSKGKGTDEVLLQLDDAFRKNIGNTKKHIGEFDHGKPLHAAAAAIGIMPTDPQQKNEWRRWLAWLSCFPNEHEVIRIFLRTSLKAEQPCIISWEEDPHGSPSLPPKITTGSTVINNQMVGLLSVKTCPAAQIPNPPCQAPMQ